MQCQCWSSLGHKVSNDLSSCVDLALHPEYTIVKQEDRKQ